jgi:hypothetical protein
MIVAYAYFYFREIQNKQIKLQRILNNYVIRYGASEFRTAKAVIEPLNFGKMLGMIEEQADGVTN